MPDPIATTTAGQVRGARTGGVIRFLAVPYAAPPVGDLRFALPAPPPPWPGVRDATQPGATAPQRGRDFPALDIAPLVGAGGRGGDDCLNACIWTPDLTAKGLPVMVFIHGGAFLGGCNDASVQDGAAFARSGIVLMSISYRLGIEGFLPIPGVPTNLGLRDQIAALAWVKDNAPAFGGDPNNITIFGESAGAMSVADLVASPLAQGLFQKAIVQSGHGSMVRSLPVARRLVDRLARSLKVTPDLEGFRKATAERCLDLLEKASLPTYRVNLREPDGREAAFGITKFLPVYGDDVLPDRPLDALSKGVGADIQVLIGANAEEMNLYFAPTGMKKRMPMLLAYLMVSGATPKAWAVLRAYGMGRKGRKAGQVATEAMSDLVFRYPARLFAAAHRGRTHLYDFEWRSPACDGELGACHGIELPFVFNTLDSCSGPQGLLGDARPQALADAVQGLWAEFARSGALPWPEYSTDTRQVYALAAGVAGADPRLPLEDIFG